jgi:hypothetical protein
MVATSPASAASSGPCHWETVLNTDQGPNGVLYTRTRVCPAGVPVDPPPVDAPLCDIASASPSTFCYGSTPCYYKDTVVPYLPPSSPPPTPGADWRVRMCFLSGTPGGLPTGTAEWVGQAPPPPSQLDQSVEATGRIDMPKATLSFNPTVRTLVNLDTWFWAQDLKAEPLRGTGAFGLVAVATPKKLEIRPGDGSVLPCGWVIAKSDGCPHVYQRSSAGGPVRAPDGRAAYQASGTAIWSLHFELGGVRVIIPGARTELRGPEMTSPVVVAEVQTLVTGTG